MSKRGGTDGVFRGLVGLLAMRLQAYYSGDKSEEKRLQDLISSLVKN